MPTIIYPPTIDYGWLYQRPQQLLKEMASLGYKVIYYNNEIYCKQRHSIMELNPNFLLTKSDIPLKYLRVERPIISWISYPPHVKLAGSYGEELIVFDAIDDASDEFSSWKKDLDKISKKADIIFTTAKKMYYYHKKYHTSVYMCPNGADYQHFNRAKRLFDDRPKDLPKNVNPIIGYFGAVAPWIDWELIKYISTKNPNLNFVIIGPKYGSFSGIVNGDNIYYLGRKSYLELPNYLQYFDVCLLPFKITSMIEGCNPIKLYEYLSSGKPVVATNMPEVTNIPGVYIGKGKEDFNAKIKESLRERFNLKDINNRINYAKKNSWENRAKYAHSIIKGYLKAKNITID